MKTWLRYAVGASALTLLAAFCLVFTEWLFFVTKPSFLQSASAAEQGRILAVIPWVIAAPVAVGASMASLPIHLVSARLARHVMALGGALLLGVVLMLMVDNFTYTLFRWRLFDLPGPGRYVYLCLWLALVVVIDLRFARWLESVRFRRFTARATGILALGAAIAVATADLDGESPQVDDLAQRPESLPNIIIFSADGIDIRRLAAFGYARNTSPFLNSVIDRGLVFENAFTNSATTTGSIAAMLTGRLPTTTRVNFRPDLFRDEDAYRHLPGILRSLGYYNAEITGRYYADADDLNMRTAFHWENGRPIDKRAPARLPPWLAKAWNFELYFLQQLSDRVTSRVVFAVAGVRFADPFREATRPEVEHHDAARLTQLTEVLESASEPFFINTHFMVPHGPQFPVYTRRFSANQAQTRDWMRDFYDDALLDVDTYLNFLFDFLGARGQLERTLIIYTTDHGERGAASNSEQRLPLVFFFPGGEPDGRRTVNAQRIDIAPTLLDYLGVRIPEWMEGQSLLADDVDPVRPIIGTGTLPGKHVDGHFQIPDVKPPLYTLNRVYLVQCQRYWSLNLRHGRLVSKAVAGHTAPCDTGQLHDDAGAKQFLLRHMLDRGYPASALETAIEGDPRLTGNLVPR